MEPTEHMPLIFSGIAFVAFCLFFLGLLNVFRNRTERYRIIEKIRQENPYHFPATNGSGGNGRSEASAYMSFFQSVGKKIAPNTPEDYTRMKLRFLRAGIRSPNAPSVHWGIKGLLMLAFSIGFLLFRISLMQPLNFQYSLTGMILFAVIGFYLPDLWLHFRTVRRKRIIFEGFPDALDLLVICVEAGLGLDAALARVGEEMKLSNSALSDELALLNLEIRAGKTREEALRNLALRTDIDDVQNLATLLIQTDRFGTSVARALRVFSDTFRTKRNQRAEEIAAKLPVKMVFPLILFIFPSLFVVVAGPAVIRIYQSLMQQF